MAAGKLQEIKWIPQRPVTYPGQNVVNLVLFAGRGRARRSRVIAAPDGGLAAPRWRSR